MFFCPAHCAKRVLKFRPPFQRRWSPEAKPLAARRSGRNPLFAHKDQERGLRGKPYQGVSPFSLRFVRVRRYVGRWSLPCPAFRPHFFGACPKKRCRAAKEKRFFYLGGSTIRVSATSRWSGRSSPDLWEGAGACLWVCTCAPIRWEVDCGPYCPFDPISLLLRKETGWSPKETRFWRWAEPDNDSDTRAIDHPRKAAITNPVRPRRRQPLR